MFNFSPPEISIIEYDKTGSIISATGTIARFGVSADEILSKTSEDLLANGFISEHIPLNTLRDNQNYHFFQKTATNKHYSVSIRRSHETILEEAVDISILIEAQNEIKRLQVELDKFKQQPSNVTSAEHVVSFSEESMNQTLLKMAQKNATILLLGESGTGKSHIAKILHNLSDRANQPFVSINCTTIPESLFESELFGYAPKSFTGASAHGKEGLIALADGGTLFLDEIGDMPLMLQAKLLQVIQDKQYLPVGSLRYRKVDVKIITATNKVLKSLVAEKLFREDLYYRLKVVEFQIPPLRKRKADINPFIDYYLTKYNQEYDEHKSIDLQAKMLMNEYPWPGNIRELQNLIHTLVILSPLTNISVQDLPAEFLTKLPSKDDIVLFGNYDTLMTQYEQKIIQQSFAINRSSRKLATSLQISQTKANKLINKHVKFLPEV